MLNYVLTKGSEHTKKQSVSSMPQKVLVYLIARSIRGHQLVTSLCSPSWKWTCCQMLRYSKLAPTDLNTFDGQRQEDVNFPLVHSNARHFTRKMWGGGGKQR